jgi:hypothetical protein
MIRTTYMKRALVGVGIASAVFAGVYGLAASLSVNSDTLGAGNATVAACQAGTVSVSYTSSYSASAPVGYQATNVNLGNLDTTSGGCGGKAVKVTLSGAANVSLGEYTGTVPSSGTTMSLSASGIAASSVTGVSVVIAG